MVQNAVFQTVTAIMLLVMTKSLYKLPQNNKDKKKWIAAIPRDNLVVSKYILA